MADAPLTYGIVIGVFIGLGAILFAARAKDIQAEKSLTWPVLNAKVRPCNESETTNRRTSQGEDIHIVKY